MLYYVKRPSEGSNPVFTRFGGLSKNRATARNKALNCGGRMYSTDGHTTALEADFWVEPEPIQGLQGRAYWAARNQVALFA